MPLHSREGKDIARNGRANNFCDLLCWHIARRGCAQVRAFAAYSVDYDLQFASRRLAVSPALSVTDRRAFESGGGTSRGRIEDVKILHAANDGSFTMASSD